jgi:hypothetical protein
MELELAWAAGFFDGEGSVFSQYMPWQRKSYLRVEIGQQDKQVLERFLKAVGFGKIIQMKSSQTKNGLRFRYYPSIQEAKLVMEKLLPYLSPIKKKQYEEALKEMLYA